MHELSVPRTFPWGPSVSVNTVEGPVKQENGLAVLSMEMQSGDLIRIVARSFDLVEL